MNCRLPNKKAVRFWNSDGLKRCNCLKIGYVLLFVYNNRNIEVGTLKLLDSSLVDSWKRSKQYGASLYKAKDAILESHELLIKKEKNAQFIKRLQPAVNQLATTVKSSHSVVVLSDTAGVLLLATGDPIYLKDTEKIYLQPGSQWSEDIHGTNSAGTVAKEKRAIAVVGTDHYLPSHHKIYCAGSPIFDSFGQLKGALNISGHVKNYNPSILQLVDTIAREIENNMLIENAKNKLVISLKNNSLSPFEALVVINEDGKITGVNRAMREILPLFNHTNVIVELSDLFMEASSLFELVHLHQLTFNIVHIKTNGGEKSFIATIIKNDLPKVSSIPTRNKNNDINVICNKEKAFSKIFGQDQSFIHALDTAKKVAPTNYNISITGESGTGKDLVSYAIHKASERSEHPFVALNCGGITKSLAESELFGYEQGAFTGARQEGHAGVFERANGGTLFLDEIAELPLDIQASLLRVLQDFKVMRIGGGEAIEVDVRIITATHADLWKKVEAGTFRDDLFYRLQGVRIQLPPLRERKDRLQYAVYFLDDIKKELQLEYLELSTSAQQLITTYQWPGNVRQLKSALREAAFLAIDGIIEMNHFPSYIVQSPEKMITSDSLLQDVENRTIIQTVQKTNGNISEAARILGIGRNTLYRKLAQIRKKTPFEF